ncbi:RNA polymerase C-22 sterol desaturase [Rhizophlyctis rosea]|nr:RNA polymerase C-22 sterol desaturase [Rhizophlyctis rosea]
MTSTNIGLTVAACAATYLIWEQLSYRQKKKHLPGPDWLPPVIGKFYDSLYPTFEGYMASLNAGPLSALSVFNRFVVLISPNDLSRKVLGSPSTAEPFLINSMPYILSPDNFVFLQGKAHTDYRKQLNPLFTRQALKSYVPLSDKVYRKHFARWLEVGKSPKPFQLHFRDLNMEVSLRVFCGDYIPDSTGDKISELYYDITAALELVNFPWAFPGTKVYRAKKAREFIVNEFMRCCKLSRAHVEAGGEPTCMIDSWIKILIEDKAAAEAGTGEERKYKQFDDRELSLTLLTFLFASQDATTSAVTWAFKLLAEHPEVLKRIREEQLEVRGLEGVGEPLTLEVLEQSKYLRRVVREVLRLRPPVLMVPYKTTQPLTLNSYTIPRNSMVIPTFWHSLHDPAIYPSPDTFNPDRWEDPNGPAEKNQKNFMVFGSGPHMCVGREYAVLQIMSVVVQGACQLKWRLHKGKESDVIRIFATTYPADGCVVEFERLRREEFGEVVKGEVGTIVAA